MLVIVINTDPLLLILPPWEETPCPELGCKYLGPELWWWWFILHPVMVANWKSKWEKHKGNCKQVTGKLTRKLIGSVVKRWITAVPNTPWRSHWIRMYQRLTSFNILFPNEQFYLLSSFRPMNTNLQNDLQNILIRSEGKLINFVSTYIFLCT